MFTVRELNIEGIRQWNLIENQFKNSSILLGNGFSINFSDTLRYRNLYDFFIKDCSPTSKELFSRFQTRNFEKVLENIEVAKKVCEALRAEVNEFEKFKSEIRQGLIDSINQIHPRPINVDYELITKIAQQFVLFDQIFTTNYDLFLYYITLETRKFGDHMFNNYNNKFNHFGEPDQMKSNHIYFLHGALFLFENGLTTLKIKRPRNGWLLETVTKQIANNKYPLFISEGKSESKLKAIQSNQYLTFCLKRLSDQKDQNLVIYGQSLSEQDSHIVEIIDKTFKKIAISIRPDDWRTKGELVAEKNRISSLFKKTEFEFFDSKTLFEFEDNEIKENY